MSPKQDRLDVFVCFVLDNEGALVGKKDIKLVKEAVVVIALEDRLDPYALVRRICVSPHAKELMQLLADQYRNTGYWIDFLHAAVSLCRPQDYVSDDDEPDEHWPDEMQIGPADVLGLFTSAADVHSIMEHHPYIEALELDQFVNTDEYWSQRVRRYIAMGDLRRAWDELCKAHRGFLRQDADRREDAISFLGREDHYVPGKWAASSVIIGLLVRELYDAMTKKGLVSPEIAIESVLEKTTIRVEQKKGHSKEVPVAGLAFACRFLSREPEGERLTFKPVGGMVLRMAAFFRQQKSAARRQKRDQAVRAYDPQRQQGE